MHACAGADVGMRDRAADVVQVASVIRLVEQIGDIETLIGIAGALTVKKRLPIPFNCCGAARSKRLTSHQLLEYTDEGVDLSLRITILSGSSVRDSVYVR
jgi:hypothetical protein